MADHADNWLAANFGGGDIGAMTAVDPDSVPVPAGSLIDWMGMRLLEVGPGAARAQMTVADVHLNQAGVAQAGAVVALADAAAGWAAKTALGRGQTFTTLELNINLLRAARPGDVLEAVVTPGHVGRTSMVLLVTVTVQGSDPTVAPRKAAEFRCTELVMG